MKLTGPLRGHNYKDGKLMKKPKSKPANEEAKNLKPGDYIADGGAIWIDISGKVVHLFESLKGHLVVEIHEPGGDCDPESAIATCSVVVQ